MVFFDTHELTDKAKVDPRKIKDGLAFVAKEESLKRDLTQEIILVAMFGINLMTRIFIFEVNIFVILKNFAELFSDGGVNKVKIVVASDEIEAVLLVFKEFP